MREREREREKYFQIDLDQRMGCIWHVIVGEEFGFEITYEVRHSITALFLF